MYTEHKAETADNTVSAAKAEGSTDLEDLETVTTSEASFCFAGLPTKEKTSETIVQNLYCISYCLGFSATVNWFFRCHDNI